MTRTDESDILLDRLDSRFRQLLNEQFEYANDTERNGQVKAEVGADVWCLFKVLLESESLKDIHKKHITYKLLAEIRRRRSMA